MFAMHGPSAKNNVVRSWKGLPRLRAVSLHSRRMLLAHVSREENTEADSFLQRGKVWQTIEKGKTIRRMGTQSNSPTAR